MDTKNSDRLIVNLKKWIVPICAGSIFVSVWFESYYTLPIIVPYVFLVCAIVLCLVCAKRKKLYLLCIGLCLLVTSYGMFRFHQEKSYRAGIIELLGQEESIEADMRVVSSPDYRESSTKIIAKYGDARILVTLPKNENIAYGDIVHIKGTLTAPKPFETDQGRIFDYSGYLAKDRIFFEIRYPTYFVVGAGDSNYFLKKLYSLKEYIRSTIIGSHMKNERGLLLGILLGERGGISKEYQDAFVKTGTIHIVALSGYNVTVISEAIAYILIPLLGVTFGIVGGAVAVVLFAIMTGLGATIVRATVMGLLAYIARMTGKEYDIGRGLLVAGTIMVLSNPWILVYDVSFQLSFLATLGLIYITPLVARWFGWFKYKGLKEIISATIATNITVLPFVAYKMGIVSLISIPSNILIAPLVPLAMLFGTLSIAIFMVFPILALPFVAISSAILSVILGVASKGSNAPLSHILIPDFSSMVVVVWYVAMVYWWYFVREKEGNKIEN